MESNGDRHHPHSLRAKRWHVGSAERKKSVLKVKSKLSNWIRQLNTHVEEWLVSIAPWETLGSDAEIFVFDELGSVHGHLVVLQHGVEADETASWNGDEEWQFLPQFVGSSWKLKCKGYVSTWEICEKFEKAFNVNWKFLVVYSSAQ